MALSIGSSGGQQNTTQNPQTAPTQAPGASIRSGGLQPGTSSSLLTNNQGENLGTAALTTVSLTGGSSQSSTAAQSQASAQTTQHINAAWLLVPVLLCVVAAGMFWAMARSAKSTTN